MPKHKGSKVVVVKSECNSCHQVANAQPNTPHQFCKGIVQGSALNHVQGLSFPERKGKWIPVTA